MLSFTVMRTIGAQSGDVGVPAASTQSATAQADGGSPSKPAKPAAPPTPKVEDVPRGVSNALASGKVVVVLFAERRAADDRATSQHFSALSRLGGRVETFRAGISELGRYAGIVAQLGVTQAPSVVIVRPDLKAVPPIEGYVESQYLLQRVRDQLK